MLKYSIFVYYVLFYQKNSPPLKKLPTIFQLSWGVLPTLPPSETASAVDLTEGPNIYKKC